MKARTLELENAIRRNGHHLANLVNEVLDLSKVEAGQLDLEKLSFNLNEALDYVFSVLSLQANEREVKLTFVVDPRVPKYVSTDPTRRRQILVNIVGNSRRNI